MEIHRHSRFGSSFTLALIDVDNLKSYNDTFGHPAGDKLLKQVGQSLKNEMRKIDFTFRYGGDEFAIIMANTDIDNAYTAAERARTAISESAGGLVNLSFGLASWPNDGVLSGEIVTAADTALYHAKRTGGNRTCIISQVVPPTAKTSENRADEKESLNTIHALAATIEARDSYIYGHSRKVRSYAVALSEAINYSAQKVSIVSHAALLHDIGKIGILDGILNNPGALNAQEFEIIKTHPPAVPKYRSPCAEFDPLSAGYTASSREVGRHRLPVRFERRNDPARCAYFGDSGCFRCDDLEKTVPCRTFSKRRNQRIRERGGGSVRPVPN
jgi:diguanylate cyclase (GGDEF)-like protein